MRWNWQQHVVHRSSDSVEDDSSGNAHGKRKIYSPRNYVALGALGVRIGGVKYGGTAADPVILDASTLKEEQARRFVVCKAVASRSRLTHYVVSVASAAKNSAAAQGWGPAPTVPWEPATGEEARATQMIRTWRLHVVHCKLGLIAQASASTGSAPGRLAANTHPGDGGPCRHTLRMLGTTMQKPWNWAVAFRASCISQINPRPLQSIPSSTRVRSRSRRLLKQVSFTSARRGGRQNHGRASLVRKPAICSQLPRWLRANLQASQHARTWQLHLHMRVRVRAQSASATHLCVFAPRRSA